MVVAPGHGHVHGGNGGIAREHNSSSSSSKRVWKVFALSIFVTIAFHQYQFSRQAVASYQSNFLVAEDGLYSGWNRHNNGGRSDSDSESLSTTQTVQAPTPERESTRGSAVITAEASITSASALASASSFKSNEGTEKANAAMVTFTRESLSTPIEIELPPSQDLLRTNSAAPTFAPQQLPSSPSSRTTTQQPSSSSSQLSTSPPLPLSPQKSTMKETTGERWKIDVKEAMRVQEKVRARNGQRKSIVKRNFKRLKNRLERVQAYQIDDPRLWHAVTPEGYKETLIKARSSMDAMVEKVYADCTVWLVPPNATNTTTTSNIPNPTDTEDKAKVDTRPLLKFQCGTSDLPVILQDTPCRSANLCLVRSDPLQWRNYYSGPANSNTIRSSEGQFRHFDLEHKFSTPKEDTQTSVNDPPNANANANARSAILTMVDSVKYLRGGYWSGKRQKYYIWECFLNKASYALRTNRDLYIWIGGFDGDGDGNGEGDRDESKNELHRRNTDVVSRTFGTHCKPESADRNVVHYYKPIAFGALFRKLKLQSRQNQQQQQQQEEEQEQEGGATDNGSGDHKAWFVDADIFFNLEAFVPRSSKNGDDNAEAEAEAEPMSLDDYFDISPQASLLGSQNPSGKVENILINGGLLGLRSRGTANANSDPLDDWVLNLSALWWYCRCGERDQIALWLLLFATWSAESSGSGSGSGSNNNIDSDSEIESGKFTYPGVAFENYLFSWYAVMPHARALFPKLQSAWSRETQSSSASASAASESESSTWSTAPTNAGLFDGGQGFLNTTRGGMYTYPLELPHVLLLPLDPFVTPVSDENTHPLQQQPRSDFYLSIVRKYQTEPTAKKSLLTHTKNVGNVCNDFQCWPYLIREGVERQGGGRGRKKRSKKPVTTPASETEETDDNESSEA